MIELAFQLNIDNPKGRWLDDKLNAVKDAGRNRYGAPNTHGAVTGYYLHNVLLPVDVICKLRGAMGEHTFTREDSYSWLKKEMKTRNSLPLTSRNKIYAPYILVAYDGEPWIMEGNHRIKVARDLKWKYLPVELKFATGGEMENGILSPDRVKKWHTKAISEGYQFDDSFTGTLEK